MDKILWKSSAFSTALLLDKRAGFVVLLRSFEGQFTFWWASQYRFEKGTLLCKYSRSRLITSTSTAELGARQLHDRRHEDHCQTSARKRGGASPFPSAGPCGRVATEPRHGLSSLKVRDRGRGVLATGRMSCLQVGHRWLPPGKPAPRSRGKEGPEKAGSNLFSCC